MLAGRRQAGTEYDVPPYPRTPVPSLPSAPLVSGLWWPSPPPIPGDDIPASEVSRPHYNLRPDSRLLLDCNTSLVLRVVLWALYAPALLPLIPSLPAFSFSCPLGFFNFFLLARSPRSSFETSTRSLFTSTPLRDSLPPRSSPYTSKRPNSSHLRYRNYIPWHCCRNDQLRPLSAPRWKPRACIRTPLPLCRAEYNRFKTSRADTTHPR